MSEQAAVRDITHQKFDHGKELVNRLIEPRGSFCRRSTPNGLPQVCMGFGVVELNSLDASEVIVVTSKLRVARGGWERSF